MTQPKFIGGLGFRDIEMFNLALLARQAWRILIKSNSLRACLLKSIYFPSGDFLKATIEGNSSKTWRAICDGLDVLKQGIIKRIGDGESTSIWDCNWLPRTGLMRPLCTLKPNPPSQVSELIDHTSMSWKTDIFQEFFIPMDSEKISRIPLSQRKQDDCWAWHTLSKWCFFSV